MVRKKIGGRKSIAKERRTEILDSYIQVIDQEGFENTSIAKIARHMDVPPSLIIHYFKTKEELIYALIEDFFFDETVSNIEEIRKLPKLCTEKFDFAHYKLRRSVPEYHSVKLLSIIF